MSNTPYGEWPDGQVPETLGILPLRNSVFFPALVIPITVGRPASKALIDDVVQSQKLIGLVTQKDPRTDEPELEDLYSVGTAARVVRVIKNGDHYNVIIQGVARFKVGESVQKQPYPVVQIESLPLEKGDPVEIKALERNLKMIAKEVIKQMPELPNEASAMLDNLSEAAQLSDVIAANLEMTVQEKQEILESTDLKQRLEKILERLTRQLEILKLSDKIQSQVKGEMEQSQREYYLRQQLKAIREELGDDGADETELDDLEEKLKKAGMPEDIEKIAKKELARLRSMRDSSPEYTIARTYVDWLVELPWKTTTEDDLDLAKVKVRLDADHYDMEKVKKRIIEYLAVRKLKADMKGPILLLVGPPGVGKTSLGRSIAEAIGRKFVRMSLGGVRDEAEIRGHRRTYIGAMPGKIVQGMKKAGTINPVMMLDEVDKLGNDFRGDPSSALLEVLDPEQNGTFQDHYLNVTYDLSKVMFIATANREDTIPAPLLDRMEVIHIPGYTIDEKLNIAKTHLVPKQLGEHGVKPEQLVLPDEVLTYAITNYTREAGVRNLERQVAGMVRGVAVELAGYDEAVAGKPYTRTVTMADVNTFLGPEKFLDETKEQFERPGIATGLAWTPTGGDLIFIEGLKMPGKGAVTLTGQLGDVMKESAQAAMGYVRANANSLGLEREFYTKEDAHIHVPSGAIPKDGPSAGVTMVTALVSLFTGIRVRDDVAMTGEVTLRGLVLPVGGIKEKVLAAHRMGIRHVIMPDKNEKDLIELPENVRKEMKFTFAKWVDDVLAAALEKRPVPITTPLTPNNPLTAGDAAPPVNPVH
jgi:ATP-dependent Lon protease